MTIGLSGLTVLGRVRLLWLLHVGRLLLAVLRLLTVGLAVLLSVVLPRWLPVGLPGITAVVGWLVPLVRHVALLP